MGLRICNYGEPVLREVGQPVTRFDADLASLADAMIETMYAADGIGLAAQQVGRALRLCVVDVRPSEGERPAFTYSLDGKSPPLGLIMPLVLCNPEVSIVDPEEALYEEGCLSFPDVRGRVRRPVGVRCEFQDCRGHPHTLEADGLLGRCVLHEVDHVNGKLFIDRMERRDRRKMETRIKQIKRESRDFLKGRKVESPDP